MDEIRRWNGEFACLSFTHILEKWNCCNFMKEFIRFKVGEIIMNWKLKSDQ